MKRDAQVDSQKV